MLTGLNESYGITTKLASTSNDCPRQTVPSALPRIEERHPGSPCLLFQRLYHRRHETVVYRGQLVGRSRRRINNTIDKLTTTQCGRRGSVAGGVPVTIRYTACQATLTAKWRHRPPSQQQCNNTVTVSSISASRSASIPKGFSAPRADSGLVIPNWDSSSSSSSSFYSSSCSLDALACIHCISSFPARSCLNPRLTARPAFTATTNRQSVFRRFHPASPLHVSPIAKNNHHLSPLPFSISNHFLTMTSEQPADAPPAGGSLADRISKPEVSEPAGTFAV